MFSQPVYNDGVCEIYRLDENDERVVKHTGIRFQKRTLGFKRFYAAQAAQTDISRVIRIPHITGIDAHDYVEIIGEGVYEVLQSQDILDITPSPIDLTLRQLEMHI